METEIVTCIVTEASSDSVSSEQQVTNESTPNDKKSSSHQLLRRRKQLNATFLAPTTPYHLTNTYARRISKPNFNQKLDVVTQRVLSGKDHKIKQLESELHIAQNKICELISENRLLRSLNKRNDAVLNRFQSVEAELPTLLSFHNSEVKSLKERFQKLSVQHREQARELRAKDATLQATKEQVANLTKLIEDKGLKERHKIALNLEEAKQRIDELDEQHKTVSRQLFLEKKKYKHHTFREQKRFKDLQTELEDANVKIMNLESKLKGKEKFITDRLTRKEFHQGYSSVKLNQSKIGQSLNSSKSQKRVTTSSTVAYSSSGLREEEDTESELSFSKDTVDNLISHHLNYSSTESDEEVSQIYRARPTSVPQLSLHTSTSTPWAVDSRTFSLRNSNCYGSQDTTLANYSAKDKYTPLPSVSNNVVTESENGDKDSTSSCQNDTELEKNDPIISSSVQVETTLNVETNVEKSDTVSNNYSKDALLAALKAIDSQHNADSCEKVTVIQETIGNGINNVDKKAELMQELFGTDNVGSKV